MKISCARLLSSPVRMCLPFIAFLAFRTPRSRANVMRMDAELRIQILRILAGYKEFTHQEARKAGIDPERAEQARQAVLEMGDDLRIEYQPGEVFFTEAIDKWTVLCDSHPWYDLHFTVLIVISLDPQAIADVCRRDARRGDTSNEQLELRGSPYLRV